MLVQAEAMVSFHRMKDDFDGISNQVEAKLPRKSVICVAILVCALLVFILGMMAGNSVERLV